MSTTRLTTRAAIGAGDADRIVTVTCSTETLGRDDVVIISAGVDLTAYRTNPVVLFQHNPDWPVARTVDIGALDGKLVARVQFPAEGISSRSDEVYGLIKAGVLNAASTGVEIRETEPINPAKRDGGVRILSCELQEFSFVSIPAVPDALITARALQETRDAMADKTETPDPRVDAMKAALLQRSLYTVGSLAALLSELGWIKGDAEWEAEYEANASTVPAQLGEAVKVLGDALIAMTTEEVAKLTGAPVGGEVVDPAVPVEIVPGDVLALAANTPVARFRLGFARAKAAMGVAMRHVPASDRVMAGHRRMATLFERQLRRV